MPHIEQGFDKTKPTNCLITEGPVFARPSCDEGLTLMTENLNQGLCMQLSRRKADGYGYGALIKYRDRL